MSWKLIAVNSLNVKNILRVNITWPVTKVVSHKFNENNRTLVVNIQNPPLKGDLLKNIFNLPEFVNLTNFYTKSKNYSTKANYTATKLGNTSAIIIVKWPPEPLI